MAQQRPHVCPNCGTELQCELPELRLDIRGALAAFERRYLEFQVNAHKGNVAHTADAIGMDRCALYRRLKALGMKSPHGPGRPRDEIGFAA